MTVQATVAVCTFNRAGRLPRLLHALSEQQSPIPFEVLFVDNNSTDPTAEVLSRLARRATVPVRWVREATQGIVAARNRAIVESLASDFLLFLDDDELPEPGWLQAALDALLNEGADCVGGRIVVDLQDIRRPRWLTGELLGFLGGLDHGDAAFWIRDRSTPVWSGNVAYRTRLFHAPLGLRFDGRYDRKGNEVGGGSDAIMFRRLLECGTRIRYRPDMVIRHLVEPWRIRRRYFLRLHYRSGLRQGRYESKASGPTIAHVPRYLYREAARHMARAAWHYLLCRPDGLRQAMTAGHTLGLIAGHRQRALGR